MTYDTSVRFKSFNKLLCAEVFLIIFTANKQHKINCFAGKLRKWN